jgi:pimeloyl-ACP methyl ester carboxylesterase
MASNQKALLPETRFLVPVAGGDLAVFRYGPENGKPILVIHGITSSNREWQCFAGSLVPLGYSLYAVDLRGRGDSHSLPGPFGMATHAQDMVAVLDFFKFFSIDVIGHSMGAFVIIALLGIAPNRVSRAVLVDGGIPLALPADVTLEQFMPLFLGPALARLAMTFESHQAYREYWKAQAAFAKGWTAMHDEYVDYDLRGEAPAMRPSTNPKAVEEDSPALFSDSIDTTLRNLDREVLMLRAVRGLQNEETPLYPEAAMNAALVNYPKIKLVTVPDVNHYDILLEQGGADACAKLIYGVEKKGDVPNFPRKA